MTRQLKTYGGNHIRDVLTEALALAKRSGEMVEFEFNGETYAVSPDDSYETAKARAETVLGHPIVSATVEQVEATASLKKMETDWAEAIAAAGVATEKEMRASDVPSIKTPEELTA